MRRLLKLQRSCDRLPAQDSKRSALEGRGAFTLIEIMVVIGIMGILLALGVPLVYNVRHRAPMVQALRDVQEVLSNARARSILQGREVDVLFFPKERRLEVAAAVGMTNAAPVVDGADNPVAVNAAPVASGSGLSAQISDRVAIDMLDINLTEYKDAERARVRFNPNGTCDEMTLILRSEKNEQEGISLEITTGLASVLNQEDLQNLRSGKL
ncbi:MAG TPA: type II secretion system protein [Verrucomicrobiae bacterium]|nr:type II secretion system protein [Verrucomicrobiae bacterium]